MGRERFIMATILTTWTTLQRGKIDGRTQQHRGLRLAGSRRAAGAPAAPAGMCSELMGMACSQKLSSAA